MYTLFFIAALIIGGVAWGLFRKHARRRFIDEFDFVRLLDKRLAAKQPQLTAAQRMDIFMGLRDWFLINHTAGRRKLAMPSQAVDDAWHEFILFTRNYRDFCQRGLGHFLHHVPAEAMSSPTQAQDGIKRSWRLACKHESIDPKSPSRLPRLFALDGALGISGGFTYHLDCMARSAAGTDAYCAGHIGCGGGCSGCGGDGDGGCGGGCGGD